MPSHRYRGIRISRSEPPPALPQDDGLVFQSPLNPVVLCPRYIFLNLNEILAEVLSYLDQADIANVLCVCQRFRAIGKPVLYRHIHIKHPKDDTFLGAYQRPTIPSRQLKRHTRSVEVDLHRSRYCYSMPLVLDSISVKTAYLNVTPFPNSAGQCDHGACALNKVSPERWVVRPSPMHIYRPATRTYFVPDLATCNAVVFLRHPHPTACCYTDRVPFRPQTHPPPVARPSKSLKFILLPHFWDYGFVFTARPVNSKPLVMSGNLTHLIRILSRQVSQYGNHRVTIVGLEDCTPFATKDYWALNKERATKWEADVQAVLRGMMYPWSDEERDLRMSTVHFVTFEDYLRTGEWRVDTLSPLLVSRWLDLLDLRRALESRRGKQQVPVAKLAGWWSIVHKYKPRKKVSPGSDD